MFQSLFLLCLPLLLLRSLFLLFSFPPLLPLALPPPPLLPLALPPLLLALPFSPTLAFFLLLLFRLLFFLLHLFFLLRLLCLLFLLRLLLLLFCSLFLLICTLFPLSFSSSSCLSSSNLGVCDPVSGMKSARSMPGPMARDVDSLALFMKAVLCDDFFQLDITVPPIPFNDEIYNSKRRLTIGFYDTDGYFLPHPSMRRAVQETKTLLEEAGHKLVAFTPPRIEYALNELAIRGFFADGGKTLADEFGPDIVDPNLKQQLFLYKVPNIVKKIASFFMRPLFPRIASHVEAHSGCSSVNDLWKHYTSIQEYRNEYVKQWRTLGMDALLCPMLSPAFNIGHPGKLFAGFSFTMLFNVLNFAVGVLPVTTVTPEDEEELKHYKGYYNDPWDKEFIKGIEGGVGLPVAVQCVALQWQEEQCLRLMKEVETVTRGRDHK
ncbi:hypothetical protein GDO78_003899 [Eleutherodactylus coqui]|uniref:Amidase domain-containing protein n=1 Tax=Eleutherodactylus coqui TaxID=57060 RepID=A0A8J6K174_ELECQ|nr:hypothetical protein GDO78_003899 [Eleutherodactylus coqui]